MPSFSLSLCACITMVTGRATWRSKTRIHSCRGPITPPLPISGMGLYPADQRLRRGRLPCCEYCWLLSLVYTLPLLYVVVSSFCLCRFVFWVLCAYLITLSYLHLRTCWTDCTLPWSGGAFDTGIKIVLLQVFGAQIFLFWNWFWILFEIKNKGQKIISWSKPKMLF